MKEKTLQKKVSLNKSTIANLHDPEMNKVAAGAGSLTGVSFCKVCKFTNESWCYPCGPC